MPSRERRRPQVKKAGDALGNIVEHAKLIGEVLGELLLAVPSAAVTLAEIREIRIAVARDIQKRPEGLLLVIIEVSVLENALECGLIENTFAAGKGVESDVRQVQGCLACFSGATWQILPASGCAQDGAGVKS